MRKVHLIAAMAAALALALMAASGTGAVAGSEKPAKLTIKKRTWDEIGWNVAGNGLTLGHATVKSVKGDKLRVKVTIEADRDDALENKGRLEVRTKQWYDKPGKPYSAEDREDYWEDTKVKTDEDGHGEKTFTVPALNEEDGKIYVQIDVRRRIGPPVWTRPAYSSDAGAVPLD